MERKIVNGQICTIIGKSQIGKQLILVSAEMVKDMAYGRYLLVEIKIFMIFIQIENLHRGSGIYDENDTDQKWFKLI
ncbi:unnamed protein product [Paramecium octaurelia]|uniref:Uncharacterized protein n=1 Tax=Paramecium octaurelia TaxID=43137 RepID=A0A8S1YIH6_PAROT|nr:unnamed protein product [Paramecium octaurelia]